MGVEVYNHNKILKGKTIFSSITRWAFRNNFIIFYLVKMVQILKILKLNILIKKLSRQHLLMELKKMLDIPTIFANKRKI